jgi:collagenase-like PrtC family protease
MKTQLFNLPLLPPESVADAAPRWQGLTPVEPPGWTPASDAPEPDAPQGEYSATLDLALIPTPPAVDAANRRVELLAPAGGPDCAFAAFDYGADAIYLGLKKFSARAEAENFTLEELDEVVAFAHSLTPRRRVFVTVNTLIQHAELPELVETLAALGEMGVMPSSSRFGVLSPRPPSLLRLELHGSTQMSVHNRAGRGARGLVPARRAGPRADPGGGATSRPRRRRDGGVHSRGALLLVQRAVPVLVAEPRPQRQPRQCAYSCRDSYEVTGAPRHSRWHADEGDASEGFPFSMKDLALPEFIPPLKAAGVSCFKIEGRKKSPLYVATTTGYYRNLIDGTFTDQERMFHEADMKTVFSRPWTKLFVQSHKDKEVADRDTVGHRGTPIGKVESVRHAGRATTGCVSGHAWRHGKHDGIQIDLPVLGKPFGFGINEMWLIDRPHREGREVFEVEAGSFIEVQLPPHHPQIPLGAPVYCSASQAVKRRYDFERPKSGLHRVRRAVEIEARLTAESLRVTARVRPSVEVSRALLGPFSAARDSAAMKTAARAAFEKLGDTKLEPRR